MGVRMCMSACVVRVRECMYVSTCVYTYVYVIVLSGCVIVCAHLCVCVNLVYV